MSDNYIKKLAKLQKKIKKPGIYHAFIHHDNWCGIYQNQPCNCNPDVTVARQPKKIGNN